MVVLTLLWPKNSWPLSSRGIQGVVEGVAGLRIIESCFRQLSTHGAVNEIVSRNKSFLIKVPPTWRYLYASGQKLLRQGVEAAEVPGRLGIRAERWQEICGACSVRVVAFEIGET